MNRFARNEGGAVAVIFAISATMIFGLAALGVDLGNAMNRKKLTQNSADFAALAGASGLPDTSDTTRQIVADYLNKNEPDTDGTDKCDTSPGPVTVAQLKDGDTTNGEVTFPTQDQITVVSPESKVQFGLANAIGFNDTCVQSVATAAIKSGGTGMAPYYAAAPCDSGPNVLKSDAGGPSIPFVVPPLSHDTETNTSVLNSASPSQVTPVAAVGDPPHLFITITGSNLGAANIDSVGFFNSDRSQPIISTVFSSQAAGAISVQLPNSVESRGDVWWIRVHHKVETTAPIPPSSDQWSARAEAQPLIVGDATLSCDPNSSSGNFGSIQIPHGFNNDKDDLVANIRDGVLPPISLKAFPPPLPADGACRTMGTPSVTSADPSPHSPGTNCVDSLTGLGAGDAYDGYLDSHAGKLVTDTSSRCHDAPQSRSTRLVLSTGESVNNDTLSCFLVNDSLHLSDLISVPTGASPKLDQSIWDSPRFTQVPILAHDPNGHAWMPIVRFVPAFITDEVTGSSRITPLFSGDTENGFVMQNPNKLRAIRMFFFDIDAMPPPPDGGPLIDYIGAGPKLVALIN
jgi:Flp pilus assembly protein TadG